MKITGYGNASVKITAGEQVLLFDPYMKDLPAGAETKDATEARKAAFLKEKTVLITHGHFDHLESIAPLYKETEAAVYCTETPAKTLRKKGFPADRIGVIDHNRGAFFFGDVRVQALPAKHIKFDGKKIRQMIFSGRTMKQFGRALKMLWMLIAYPAGDECLMYEIRRGDEIVQLLGSAGLKEDTMYLTGADALILPYQGRSNMAEYCLEIVEKLKPKCVILDHYDDSFPPISKQEKPEEFEAVLHEKFPEIDFKILRENETIEIVAPAKEEK